MDSLLRVLHYSLPVHWSDWPFKRDSKSVSRTGGMCSFCHLPREILSTNWKKPNKMNLFSVTLCLFDATTYSSLCSNNMHSWLRLSTRQRQMPLWLHFHLTIKLCLVLQHRNSKQTIEHPLALCCTLFEEGFLLLIKRSMEFTSFSKSSWALTW